MASKAASRPPSGIQQKSLGPKHGRSLLSSVSKTSKPKPLIPRKSEEQDGLAAVDSIKFHPSVHCSSPNTPLPDSDIEPYANEISSSKGADIEEKISELRSVKDGPKAVESGKSSICRGSSGSDVSDESSCGSYTSRIS